MAKRVLYTTAQELVRSGDETGLVEHLKTFSQKTTKTRSKTVPKFTDNIWFCIDSEVTPINEESALYLAFQSENQKLIKILNQFNAEWNSQDRLEKQISCLYSRIVLLEGETENCTREYENKLEKLEKKNLKLKNRVTVLSEGDTNMETVRILKENSDQQKIIITLEEKIEKMKLQKKEEKKSKKNTQEALPVNFLEPDNTDDVMELLRGKLSKMSVENKELKTEVKVKNKKDQEKKDEQNGILLKYGGKENLNPEKVCKLDKNNKKLADENRDLKKMVSGLEVKVTRLEGLLNGKQQEIIKLVKSSLK